MTEKADTPKEQKPKTMATLITAAIIAAVPGVYNTWQALDAAHKAKVEQKVRTKQESELQGYAKTLQAEIEALKKTCVSHKDLLDLMVKLQRQESYRSKESELETKIRDLRIRMKAARSAKRLLRQLMKKAPKLTPPAKARKSLK